MTPREHSRPDPGAAEALTLREIQRAIEHLGREDRAMLRPWILARYDVRGYRAVGLGGPVPDSGGGR